MYTTNGSIAPPNAKQALLTLRIIWAALSFGVAVFATVFSLNITPPQPAINPFGIMAYLPFILLIPAIPTAFIIRSVRYKAGRTPDGTVAPPAYCGANIVFFAIFEGLTFISLVFSFFFGPLFPTIIAGIIAYLFLLTAFPIGSQLRPKLHQKVGNLDL